MDPHRRSKLFIVFLRGMAISAAAVILMIPRLFDSDSALPVWIPVAVGVLALALGGGAVYLRADRGSAGRHGTPPTD